jgi:hypothetical protein
MRVVQLPDADAVRITCDGEEFSAWRPIGADSIELDLMIGEHEFVVRTGYHGGGAEVARERATPALGVVRSAPVPPSPAAIAAAKSCRCC